MEAMEKHKGIVTITVNPSIDTLYKLKEFNTGKTHRSPAPIRTAGGKGLNVTRVIRQLGENVIATGFLGGDSGEFIRRELKRMAIHDQFIEIEDVTRTCLAMVDSEGKQTEILESGPKIKDKEIEELKKQFSELLDQTEILVISGSLPQATSPSLYQYFLEEALRKDVKVLLDTSGQTLLDCLAFKPFMIKPNFEELEQIVERKIVSETDIWQAIDELQGNGIPLVIVSNGEKGAFVSYTGQRFYVPTARIEAVSAVGSGDSFVAGMAVGLAKNDPIEKILTLASACGAANALEATTGYIELENVERLQKQIKIKRI